MSNPIEELYLAAQEIVKRTRTAFVEQGKNPQELRLPIIMRGTDLRVTIEAGPQVAAQNAMEYASLKSNEKVAWSSTNNND